MNSKKPKMSYRCLIFPSLKKIYYHCTHQAILAPEAGWTKFYIVCLKKKSTV